MDAPRKVGLARYCQDCTRCAAACPPKALPFGAPDLGPDSPSTIRGVRKWSADCEKCFGYWAKIRTDCAICMRVCPFNRRYARLADRVWRRIALSRFRWLARAWAARRPRGRLKPAVWWQRLQS